MNDNHIETKQERRAKRLRKKREMKKHGKSLAQIYRDAILKRLRGK